MVEVAAAAPRRLTSEAIAVAQDIPPKFLEQIMADLRRAGIIQSRRGADGGYTLARHAADVSVADVIRAVDGPLAWVRDQRPGSIVYEGHAEPLGEVWVAVRAALRRVLDDVSIEQLLAGDLPEAVTSLTADPRAWED